MYYIDYHGYYLFYILPFWRNKTLILFFTQKCLLTLGKNKVEKIFLSTLNWKVEEKTNNLTLQKILVQISNIYTVKVY